MKYKIHIKQVKREYFIESEKDSNGKYKKIPKMKYKEECLPDLYIGEIEKDGLSYMFYFNSIKEISEREDSICYRIVAHDAMDYRDNSQKVFVEFKLRDDFISTIIIETTYNKVYKQLQKELEAYNIQKVEEDSSLNYLCDVLAINKGKLNIEKFKECIRDLLVTSAAHTISDSVCTGGINLNYPQGPAVFTGETYVHVTDR